MNTKLLPFLKKLEQYNIYYKLNRIRDSILVEIVVPGQRWEVEFFEDDTVEVEKFISEGFIHGETELNTLFACFSD